MDDTQFILSVQLCRPIDRPFLRHPPPATRGESIVMVIDSAIWHAPIACQIKNETLLEMVGQREGAGRPATAASNAMPSGVLSYFA